MLKTLLTAAVAVAAGGASIAAAAPANAATPPEHWQSSVQGAPTSLKSGSALGDSLWHDKSGFHLRVTHPGSDRVVFTGVIHANKRMHATGARLEKGDIYRLSKDRKTLTFAFVDYGHIDGVNFTTDGATKVTVSRLHVGDADQTAAQVFLGSGSANPSAIPFTVTRSAS